MLIVGVTGSQRRRRGEPGRAGVSRAGAVVPGRAGRRARRSRAGIVPGQSRRAVQVHQAVGLLPGRGADRVEIAGDHKPPRPVPVIGQLPCLLVDPACRASTAPARVGSITKHVVSGPMNTYSHHFAGPSPSSGDKTCQLVSSACRCQESRDLAVIASSSGDSNLSLDAPAQRAAVICRRTRPRWHARLRSRRHGG